MAKTALTETENYNGTGKSHTKTEIETIDSHCKLLPV